jgi:hypothetical protein
MRANPPPSDRRARPVAVALLLAAVAAPPVRGDAAAQLAEARALRAERDELELALQRQLRQVPVEPDSEATLARLRRYAEIAELRLDDARVLAAAPAPADGSPSPLRLERIELAGAGPLPEVAAFLRFVASDTLRLRDLEALELTNGGSGLRFTTRLVAPLWHAPSAADGPAASVPAAPDAALRAEVERLRARRAALDDWSARSAAGRLLAASTLLDALADLEGAAWSAIRVGDRIEIAGATLGAAARDGLAAALDGAGFVIAAAGRAEAGACRPFALALAAPPASARWLTAPAQEIASDPAAVALCAIAPEPPVGSARATGDAARAGAFSMHARGLALADLFRVLHEEAGGDFAVAPAVRGAVDLDLRGVTVDEALAALAPLGVAVADGPLRLVTMGAPPAPRVDEWAGETASFAFRDLPIADLLCLIEGFFGLPSRVDPALDAEVTLFAREQPWDLVLSRALEATGLGYTIVGNVAHVARPERLARGTDGDWLPACEAADRCPAPFAERPVELADLAAEDLRLAAIVERPDGTRAAWAYGAAQQLHGLEPARPLHGATVVAVEPAGVLLRDGTGGTFRLDLGR